MNWEMTFGIVLFVMAVCIVLIIVMIVRQVRDRDAEEKGTDDSQEILAESTLLPDEEPAIEPVIEPAVEPVAAPIPSMQVEAVVEQPASLLVEAEPSSPAPSIDKKYYVLMYRDPVTDKLGIELPTKSAVLDKSQLTSIELTMVKGFSRKLQKWLGDDEAEEKPQDVMPADAPITPLDYQSDAKPLENPMSRNIFALRQESLVDTGLPSIASQINSVLQNILIKENYQGKSIYLKDNTDGDMVVVYGTEEYVGVDSIPYPNIAKLIRRAAELWTDQSLRNKG